MTDECIRDMYHVEDLPNRKTEDVINEFIKKYMLSNARKCFAFHRQTVFQQTIRSKYIVESFNTTESHSSENSNND
ncbi:hypothetical protein BDA99DRAFT_560546 [Phascolomyces articulosus]|uniref:Uncharacterized protein n=1 Tax=Phascolomyces articulosus TaxID=60185 RepID=A0AAD5PDU4_9FUNG|nr:hypothetical protein BDA99DRAFT_560546 [Phascolomyces articulosus]